ncbi:MAG: hypothetical protein Q9175_007263 [Cornicularia normoerica]
MVSLTDVQSSNARIPSALPPGLVAVFVGATSGVGEVSLKQFAKHARQPRVYFVGRSQEAGDRIAAECEALNSEGKYIFVKADTSLIRTVDDVCSDIKSKETAVNLLYLSTGALVMTETSEGLQVGTALITYSRNRFIVNLLPLLQQATALRRVVNAFAAGKEGPISIDDFQGRKVPLLSARGHGSSLVTLSLEALAKKAPDVTFIHNFPGPFKSNLLRGGQGAAIFVLKVVSTLTSPMLTWYSGQECGERHLFLATSARFPARSNRDLTSGVPLTGEVAVARGTNGESGSGVYSVDLAGESSGPEVEELLAKFRKEGVVEKFWKHTEDEFRRITGLEAA